MGEETWQGGQDAEVRSVCMGRDPLGHNEVTRMCVAGDNGQDSQVRGLHVV